MDEDRMFWGVIIHPDKRYEQTVEESFHVSKACLELPTPGSPPKGVTTLYVECEGEEFILSHLGAPGEGVGVLADNLDLNFVAGEKICFRTSGSGTVHLTGFLQPTEDFSGGFDSDDQESEVEEEDEKVLQLVMNGKKRRQVSGETEQASKKAKKEEGLKKALVKAKEASKKLLAEQDKKKKTSDDDDEDMEEDDDSEDSDYEDMDDEMGEEEEEDEEGSEEEEEESSDEDNDEASPEVKKTGGEEAQKAKNKSPEKKEQKTPKAEKTPKKEGGSEAPKTPKQESGKKQQQQQTPKQKQQNQTPKKTPKRTLKGGIVCEILKEGTGPEAKRGKMVGMYYDGRLASNNKRFDSSLKGTPFKFRLGHGEVIKGWDVGVEGMKVGGKRKLTIPAKMAYGSDGAPPSIPPNSTLVFEVECKYVG